MKYIENPLTIRSRKMDIRMWVMVTDWEPLTTWVYEGTRARLAYSVYNLDNNDLDSHLTNNKVFERVNWEKKSYFEKAVALLFE